MGWNLSDERKDILDNGFKFLTNFIDEKENITERL